MSERLQIGKASFNRNSAFAGKSKWFYLKDNTDNVYRVLPPIKGMAPTGRISKWYAVHRNFRDSKGKQKAFLCLEERTKEGVVTRHCPACDRVKELEAQINLAKSQGANPEQLKSYRMSHIFPLIVEKRYYINVVNQENSIGTLAIGSKMWKSLEQLGKEWENKGYDIAGMQGIFLNFKKMSAFKGDKDAVHSVEVYMQPSKDGSFRFVTHEITAEFAERLAQEAADLTTLFKHLTPEQVEMLVRLEGEDRAAKVDEYFSAAEHTDEGKVEQVGDSAFAAPVPNSNVSVVARAEVSPTGVTMHTPTLPENFAPKPNVNTGQFSGPQATSAPVGTGVVKSTLSDDEFLAIIKPAK